MTANIETAYTYLYAAGDIAHQVVRERGKGFKQRRPNGRGGWVTNLDGVPGLPYRLPELLAADADLPVFLVEGEKDADALAAIGLVASTLPGGAVTSLSPGQRTKQAIEALSNAIAGRNLVILPDNDEAGRKHSEYLTSALTGVAASLRVCNLPDLPESGDVSDFLDAGGSKDSLLALARCTPPYPTKKLEEPKEYSQDDWYRKCEVTSKGGVLANHANVMLAMREEKLWRGVVAYDEMSNCPILLKPAPVCPGAPPDTGSFPREWSDNDSRRALEHLQLLGFPRLKLTDLNQAIEQIAQENRIHPLRDWLDGLEWDGISLIDGETTKDGEIIEPFATRYLGCADTAYAREVCRVLLLGAVTRVFEPGCKFDYMVVLEGKQGTGKSTFCRELFGEKYFSDNLREMHSKDAALHLRGHWGIEVSELAGLKRSEIETAKSFLTRQTDRLRSPYARHEQSWPRQCVFIGTTNQADYLKDASGSRRFLPLSTGDIDVELVRIERAQIWAEAVARYRNGERPVFDPALLHLAKLEQDARYDEDVWTPKIASYLETKTRVTYTELLEEALSITTDRHDQRQRYRLRGILQSLGWRQSRTRIGRFWERPCDSV